VLLEMTGSTLLLRRFCVPIRVVLAWRDGGAHLDGSGIMA